MPALVIFPLPVPQQQIVAAFKNQIAELTGVRRTSSLPPHITLYRPISLDAGRLTGIVSLATAGLIKIPIRINAVGTFEPGFVVLMVDDAPRLLQLREALRHRISRQREHRHEKYDRRYTPHTTVAELPTGVFKEALPQIQATEFALTLPRDPLVFQLSEIQVWHREVSSSPWVLRKSFTLWS